MSDGMVGLECSSLWSRDIDVTQTDQKSFRYGYGEEWRRPDSLIKLLMRSSRQLLECIDDWSLAVNSKSNVDVIYLDFCKAFDCVVH